MTMRLVLCRTAGNIVSTLPQDRDLAAWHGALIAEIDAGLGTAHAAILAAPESGLGGVEWVALGSRALPAAELPAGAQTQLMAALGAILADIEQLAGTGRAPLLASAWPALRRLPNEGFVYAVDGRPVLAAWGHGPAAAATWPDPLASIMPAREKTFESMAGPVRPGWPVIGGLLAAAFIFGLLLSVMALRPFTCAISAQAAAQLNNANAQIARNATLAGALSQLDSQAALQRAQCNRALPQTSWNSGNLSMLKGCWHLTSNMVMYNVISEHPLRMDDKHPITVTNWLLCFNDFGIGTQSVSFSDGTACSGPLTSGFNARHQMLVHEPVRCTGAHIFLEPGDWTCDRLSDSQASCRRQDRSGFSNGMFQR